MLFGSIALLVAAAVYVGMHPGRAASAFASMAPDASVQAPPTAPLDEQSLAKTHRAPVIATPRLRANPADSESLQALVLATQFKELRERASKDPRFAFALASALHTCSGADAAYHALARDADLPNVQPEKKLEALNRKYAMCAGLSAADFEQQYELMTMAAKAGVLDAQIRYVEVAAWAISSGYVQRTPNAMDEVRANMEDFLVAASRSGDPEALYRTFTMYNRGGLVPRDPVRAFQYFEQYSRNVNVIDANQARLIAEQRARLLAQLSPEQLRQVQLR